MGIEKSTFKGHHNMDHRWRCIKKWCKWGNIIAHGFYKTWQLGYSSTLLDLIFSSSCCFFSSGGNQDIHRFQRSVLVDSQPLLHCFYFGSRFISIILIFGNIIFTDSSIRLAVWPNIFSSNWWFSRLHF